MNTLVSNHSLSLGHTNSFCVGMLEDSEFGKILNPVIQVEAASTVLNMYCTIWCWQGSRLTCATI